MCSVCERVSNQSLLISKSLRVFLSIPPKSMHIEIRSALIVQETAQSFQPLVNESMVTIRVCVTKALKSMKILVGIETNVEICLMNVMN